MLTTTYVFFFFFNDTATTEIYTLSLHDALPISLYGADASSGVIQIITKQGKMGGRTFSQKVTTERSEEHTSELQSQSNLVCRLLLEKKKKKNVYINTVQHVHYLITALDLATLLH